MKSFLNFLVAFILILQTGFLSAIPAHAEGEVTETPTPETTNTPEPTAAETASPTLEATSTPTLEVVETEPVVVSEEITLSLSSDPPFIKRGGELYLEWSIGGLKEITKGTLLRFYLPKGLKLIDAGIGTLNEEGGVLDIEIIELIGKVGFIVGEEVETPLVITAEFLQEEKSLAQAAVSLLELNETLIESTGGTADGLAGKIKVTFPEGALSEKVKVSIERPSKESLPVKSLSGMPFEITAFSEVSKAEVSEFSTPVEIQVAYSEAGLIDESDLRLYWYDPTDGQWKLPLRQHVDTENNILYGYTDHFTVFDTYNSNWQTAITPSLSGFQTSGFTGAASFSMPIKVPAGPGGFAPSLTLSYSSSVVDSAGSSTQASWVGMGWSLTTSYIERNGHGTNGVRDDSFQLNLNGMSVELFPGADGKYHASDENFYKTEFIVPDYDEQRSTWVIWDKTGNQYFFGHRTNYLHEQLCGDGYEINPYVWRWSLTRVRNVFGEEMTYSYEQETKTIHYLDCKGQPDSILAPTWVYPREIKYSNGRYHILFNRDTTTRKDYKTLWESEYSFYTAYQKSLLESIWVEQDANGDGTFDTRIRSYKFNYLYTIFPDLIWEAGGRTPSLRKVQEFGSDGVTSQPAYYFTYGDGMHLTIASNGYGGTTTFVYDDYDHDNDPNDTEYPWGETIPYQTWGNNVPDYMAPVWGNPFMHHFTTNTEGWTRTDPLTSGVIYNAGGGASISIWGLVQNLDTNKTINSFQPGRWYMFIASAKADDSSGTHDVKFGFRYTQGGVNKSAWGDVIPLTTSFQTVSSGLVFLPADASSFTPRILSTGMNRLNWYYIYPLTTAYRVTDQTVTAGGNTYTYKYDYAGAAMNIPANLTDGNSEAAAGPHPYNRPFTEFRGHSQVTETSPYGGTTVTSYAQTDCLSGRVTETKAKIGGVVVQESSVNYHISPTGDDECTAWDSTLVLFDQDTRNPNLYNTPFDALQYRWTRVTSENQTVYGGGIPSTLNTYYIYDSTYGNLTLKEVSGTNIETTQTHINYAINTSGGRWLVGLPSRVWVTDDAELTTFAETLNLYDYNNLHTAAPINGKLTGKRTLVSGTQYSQANLIYDDFGNVTSQIAYIGYWNSGDPNTPPTGAQPTFACYGGGVPVDETPCEDDGYHTYPLWIKNSFNHITFINYSNPAVPQTAYTGYTFGVPVSETDPNNVMTSAQYDVFGRLKALARPPDNLSSPTLLINYTDANPFTVTLTQKIDGTQDFTLVRTYDGLGRPTRVRTNGSASVVDFTYGYENGARVDKQSMPYTSTASYWTRVQYDALARPMTVTAPDGTITSYSYSGLQTTVTDANDKATATETDILGRTLSVDAPTGPDIAFTYDPLGNLLTAERGGSIVVMSYDNAGRKIAMDDPDMGKKGTIDDTQWGWTYQYDALGNLTRQVDAKDQVTCLYYDNLNRPKGKKYLVEGATCPPDPGTGNYDVEFKYDEGINGIGRRTSMEDDSGSTSWLYDSRGRVREETRSITGTSDFVTGWSYNSADLPVTMTYPDGEVVTTQYDNRMLPINVAGTDNYVSTMTYDSAGRLLTRLLGNGLTQTYGYYDWNEKVYVNDILVGQGGRLETLVTGTLQNLSYKYDAVGNVKQIVDSHAGETSLYGYDALNRLTSWQLNTDPVENYLYDTSTGNLASKAGTDLTYDAQVTCSAENRVIPHAVSAMAANSYEYDCNGNQTDRNVGGETYKLIYDAENRMTEVKKNDVTMALFTYNGDGQRVKSVINGEDIYFVGRYYEFNVTTDKVTKYYFAGASRVAIRKYTIPQSMEVENLLGDHLGSTSITTDMDGDIVSEMRYTPWGEVRSHWIDPTLTTSPAYKLPIYSFTGQRSYMDDPSTTEIEGFGLMDYNARMYDPVLGRFTSADSIVAGGVQGFDRYNYVSNAPTIYTDPSGHEAYVTPKENTPYCAKEPRKYNVVAMNRAKKSRGMIGGWQPHLTSYAIASIGAQNPYPLDRQSNFWNTIRPLCPWCSPMFYSGEGIALISDAQMEWGFGTVVMYNNDKNRNGVGLGLRQPGDLFPDQNNDDIALIGMMRRIQAIFNQYNFRCDGNQCNNPTNAFLIAAMAGNAMLPGDIDDLKFGWGNLDLPDTKGVFDWINWIARDNNYVTVLQDFVNNMAWLESQGSDLPKGIDWNYVCGLLDK